MCRADHTGKLAGCDNDICVMSGVFAVEKFHITFTFLSYARHNRNSYHVFRFYTDRLSEISLHHCTEHLLR